MSKFKRNFILIFGFVLFVNFLFFPCNKVEYNIHFALKETGKVELSNFLEWLKKQEGLKEKRTYTLEELLEEARPEKIYWVNSEYKKIFFPLVISRASKYKKYIKWETSVLLMLEEKTKVRAELEMEYERLRKGRSTLKTEELFRDEATMDRAKKKKELSPLAKANLKVYEIEEEIKEIQKEKNKEFHAKFGYDPFYHQIRAGIFLMELGLLILIGVLSYFMLIGVMKISTVLREKRETGADRMKRRKSGTILILSGIGIVLIFNQLKDRRGDVDIFGIDFPYEYAFAFAVILSLVGVGKIVFSFLLEDTKPKK